LAARYGSELEAVGGRGELNRRAARLEQFFATDSQLDMARSSVCAWIRERAQPFLDDNTPRRDRFDLLAALDGIPTDNEESRIQFSIDANSALPRAAETLRKAEQRFASPMTHWDLPEAQDLAGKLAHITRKIEPLPGFRDELDRTALRIEFEHLPGS